MSLPGSSAQLAISNEKRDDCYNAGKAVQRLVEQNIRPSDILSRESFENAITTCIALGGSTNIVLHLLAIAHCADIDITIDDFERLGEKVPLLCDVKPFGKYNMSHLIRIGGIQPMMKLLLDRGMLHPNCLTVTGKTIAENLENIGPYPKDQDIVHHWNDPIKETSHLRIERQPGPYWWYREDYWERRSLLQRNRKSLRRRGRCSQGILRGDVVKGDVVVIRNEGPVGGPGMREMLSPTSAVAGRGLINDVALITDGRFSGGSHGFDVGHITPEAACGGPIGVVQSGDEIEIDAVKNTISLNIPNSEYESRMDAYQPKGAGETRGVLGKYAKLVASASEGAVTDK